MAHMQKLVSSGSSPPERKQGDTDQTTHATHAVQKRDPRKRHRPGRYKPPPIETRRKLLDRRNRNRAKIKLQETGKLPKAKKAHRAKKTRDQELRDEKELETLRKEVVELRASQTIDQQFLSTLESDEIMKNMYGQLLSIRTELENERQEKAKTEARLQEEHHRNAQLYKWIRDMITKNNLQEAFEKQSEPNRPKTSPITRICHIEYDNDGSQIRKGTKWAQNAAQGIVIPETPEEIQEIVKRLLRAEYKYELLKTQNRKRNAEAKTLEASERPRKTQKLNLEGLQGGEPLPRFIQDWCEDWCDTHISPGTATANGSEAANAVASHIAQGCDSTKEGEEASIDSSSDSSSDSGDADEPNDSDKDPEAFVNKACPASCSGAPQIIQQAAPEPASEPATTDQRKTRTIDESQRRLAAWIHACGKSLSEKINGPTDLEHEGTKEFTHDPDFQTHMRLEINTRLDGVTRDLIYTARSDTDNVKLQKSWATRLLLNKRDTLTTVANAYEETVGRSLYEGEVDVEALRRTLEKAGKLDNACAGMRRNQWSACAGMRKHNQRDEFSKLWAHLRGAGAFKNSLSQLEQGVPLRSVLKETLGVHSDFLAMLVARDLAVLLPELVSQADVDACTCVGEGAEQTLVDCTECPRDGKWVKKGKNKEKNVWEYSSKCKETFPERLKQLHARLLELLDPELMKLVVPQGWTLDLTENACCELRRWDHARTHRKRNQEDKDARQKQRSKEIRDTWQMLGFSSLPLCAHEP